MYQKEFNAILTGSSGVFAGQLMVRKRHRKLEICKVPRRRPGKGTEGQQVQRDRWKEANNYYRSVAKIPELKTLYKKDLPPGWNAQNRAVKDYYNAPQITAVDSQGYTGEPGDIVRITAIDDFMVCKVSVAIYDDQNRLVDGGEAVYDEVLEEWLFTATQLHQSKGRMEITAEDLPGNTDHIILDIICGAAIIWVEAFIPAAPQPLVTIQVEAWKRGAAIPPGLLRLKT